MCEIYAVSFTEKLDQQMFDNLFELVSAERQSKINRFIKWQDAQRSLISDTLIRNIICNKLKIKNNEISFSKNSYGKPFLNNYTNLQFNISHSGKWILCATDNEPIGVDVQEIRPIDLDIAKRFFSEKEYNDLLEQPEKNRLSYFYDLWSLKESYIKALGKGLSIPLNSFSFSFHNNNILLQTSKNNKNFYFKQYNIDNDYKLSICCSNDYFPENITVKTISDIFSFFN